MKEYFFKPGDIVRVRTDLTSMNDDGRFVDYYMGNDKRANNTATHEMCGLRGQYVTISKIEAGQYRIKEMGCFWTDEMFEEYLNRNDVLHDDPDPEPVSFEDILSFYGMHG